MKDIKDIREIIPSFNTKTDPFGENLSGEHAYKRTERIVSAIYLITNHVRHDEPLRDRIRSLGHQMLSEVMALRSGFQATTHEKRMALLAHVRESVSLVHLLQLSGYVSDHNASMLLHALDDLGMFLAESQYSALSDGIQLKREDFVPTKKALDRRQSIPKDSVEKPQSRTALNLSSKPRVVNNAIKTNRASGRSVQTEVHNERHQLITDILERGGSLGIKDIASQMVGCSEKTIQRELAILIKDGSVQKAGEKRWSSYSLAK